MKAAGRRGRTRTTPVMTPAKFPTPKRALETATAKARRSLGLTRGFTGFRSRRLTKRPIAPPRICFIAPRDETLGGAAEFRRANAGSADLRSRSPQLRRAKAVEVFLQIRVAVTIAI